jgi:uncharacterized protein (TIGR02145 family)
MPSHNVTFNANFLEFVCGSSTIYDFDGNAYNTVQIGSQCWMKENLKTTHRRGGQPIPYETGYKWYDNDIAWKDIYGALYWNPSGANGLGGAVCPSGWVVPHLDNFDDLFVYIGGIESHNANKLKSCRQVNSPLGGDCNTSEHPRWEEEANYYGTDDYGFSALPGGYGDEDGGTYAMGGEGWWWSRTARFNGWPTPYFIVILNGFGEVHINWSPSNFLSIRCVQL